MDATLSNSFFYFFSAVPQVLAGVLALFGVFVIFKIQSLTTELITVATTFLTSLRNYANILHEDEAIDASQKLLIELNRGIQSKNIKELKNAIDAYANKITNFNEAYEQDTKKFLVLYFTVRGLIRNTIQSSIFTAITILVCLASIPFGKWFISHPDILLILFTAIIISIAVIFYKLISILKKSFS